MRILQTVFQMMDYGGIVNYVELLSRGFRRLGHDVDVVILRNSDKEPYTRAESTVVQGAYRSRVANMVHVTEGWYGVPVYSFGSRRQRKIWRKFAREYDLILHQIPVPEADANGHWRKLYDVDVPQILVSHDAHFPERYPHMIDIADKVVGIAAVNPASYWSLEHFPAPRCLIGSPHVPINEDRFPDWGDRDRSFAAAHVWKPWKRMDLLVQAIPFTKKLKLKNWLGGDGIEARYMRSIEKCKPRYAGIWKRALKAGMNYDGFVTPKDIQRQYGHARVMVDLSFSKKFQPYGNHVNRSTFEAYNCGAIPLLVHENMVERSGAPTLFHAGHTHIEITADASPKDVAEAINAVTRYHPRLAREIVENGRAILKKHWTHDKSAKYFIELAEGASKCGIYRRRVTGKLTPELKAARDKYLSRITR